MTKMLDYMKGIGYKKISIAIFCLIGIVSLIILAIYFRVDEKTSGEVSATPSKLNLNMSTTLMMPSSTTTKTTEIPTSPSPVSTERETTLNSTTTMPIELQTSPRSMSTRKKAILNSTTTMTTEIPTSPSPMSTERESLTISSPTMPTEISVPSSSMSTEEEITLNSSSTTTTESQTLPNLMSIEGRSEPFELPTDDESYSKVKHTQLFMQNCSNNNDCKTNQLCSKTNQCVCDFGYAFDSNGECQENNECICLEGAYSDNSTCSKEQTLDFLFIVKDVVAKRIKSSEHNKYPQSYVAVENDCLNKLAYFVKKSSILNDKYEILKISYNGEDVVKLIEDDDFIKGISFDWTTNNTYWITSNEIKVNNIQQDKVESTTVIKENIINPKDIVIHPGYRKIFWSNWYPEKNTGQLMWANENGSDISVFYESEKVKHPNVLAINWAKNYLCWSDRIIKEINCVDIENPGDLQTIATDIDEPFDLGITSNNYYWTNLKQKKILEFDGDDYTYDKMQEVIMSIPDDADSILYGFVGVSSKCPELN